MGLPDISFRILFLFHVQQATTLFLNAGSHGSTFYPRCFVEQSFSRTEQRECRYTCSNHLSMLPEIKFLKDLAQLKQFQFTYSIQSRSSFVKSALYIVYGESFVGYREEIKSQHTLEFSCLDCLTVYLSLSLCHFTFTLDDLVQIFLVAQLSIRKVLMKLK